MTNSTSSARDRGSRASMRSAAALVVGATLLVALALKVGSRDSAPNIILPANQLALPTANAETPVANDRGTTIQRALDGTISVDVQNVPLQQAVRSLAARTAAPVQFALDPIHDEGTSIETPVTLQAPEITLRSALTILLRPHQLAFVDLEEYLLITTTTAAADILGTRTYDVTDLVVETSAKYPGRPSYASLMDFIQLGTRYENWESLSGPGSMVELTLGSKRVLTIRQTSAVHSKISRILADVRLARELRTAGKPSPIHVNSDRSSAVLREVAIRQALERPVGIEVRDRPLEELLAMIAREAKIPLVIETVKLTDEGVDPRKSVTLHYPQISIRAALKLLLEPVQLTWLIQNEVLFITTTGHAGDLIENRVYDVSEIAPRYRSENGRESYDITSLERLITTTILPESWGPGHPDIGILRFPNTVVLEIPQTQSTHEEILQLLNELRSFRLRQSPEEQVTQYKAPAESSLRFQWRQVDPKRDALVRGNNQFALDLYARLAKDTPGNLLVSPFCISAAVALAYGGARGQTAAEIGQAMHYIVRQEDVPSAFRSMSPGMFLWGPDARFIVTSQFWGQQGIEYREPFVKTLNEAYRTGVLPLDFGDPVQAAQAINDWTVARTRGSIVRLANLDDFQPGATFAVASAVHFDGKWSRPFDPGSTTLAGFASPQGSVDVALMHRAADSCRIATLDGIQILEKSYGTGDVSMVVLLPPETPTGLADLEKALDETRLARWLAAEDSKSVDVYLPRVQLESAFNLRWELELMGMRLAFDANQADFSGIAEKPPLALSGVIHKAQVHIDEQGPRPAPGMDSNSGEPVGRRSLSSNGPATGHEVGSKPDAPLESEPAKPVFRADRPFLFLIRDTQNGSLLFIGRVVRPWL
jgi:serpin B